MGFDGDDRDANASPSQGPLAIPAPSRPLPTSIAPFDPDDLFGAQLSRWFVQLAPPARKAWSALFAQAARVPRRRAKWVAWVQSPSARRAVEEVEPFVDTLAAGALTHADLASHAYDAEEGRARPTTTSRVNRDVLGGIVLLLSGLGHPEMDARLETLLLKAWTKVPEVGAAAPRLGLQLVTAMAHGADSTRVRLVHAMTRLRVERPVSAAWTQLDGLAPEGARGKDFRLLLLARNNAESLLVQVLQDLWKERVRGAQWTTGLHAPTLLQTATTDLGSQVLGGLVWELDGRSVQIREARFIDLDGRPVSAEGRVDLWVAKGPDTARWLKRLGARQPFAQIAIDSSGSSALADTLRAIEADPTDLALRAVYADQLQQAGDPRGEFIALQLAGGRRTSRERELAGAHGRAWLGELDPHLADRPLVYRDGFLRECQLKTNRDPLPASRKWATVEILHCDLERRLPPQECATALREIYALRAVPAEVWPRVRVYGYGRPTWARERMDVDSLTGIRQAFPALEVLDMSHCPFPASLWSEVESWGLREIRICTTPSDVPAWYAITNSPGGPRVRLTQVRPTVERRPAGWEYLLDGSELTVRRGARADPADLERWLDTVELRWKRVTLRTSKRDDPVVAGLSARDMQVTLDRT